MPSNKTVIEEKHRRAIKNFMDKQGLTSYSWSKISGVPVSTIASFLNGKGHSITSSNLALLAESAGTSVSVLLGEQKRTDGNLLRQCCQNLLKKTQGGDISMSNEQFLKVALQMQAIIEEDLPMGATEVSDGMISHLIREATK